MFLVSGGVPTSQQIHKVRKCGKEQPKKNLKKEGSSFSTPKLDFLDMHRPYYGKETQMKKLPPSYKST